MPQIERQGSSTVPVTAYYPRVIGGVCEFCGILDPQSDKPQYLLCRHYKTIGNLQCSYCPDSKNPEEVVMNNTLNIHGHPDNPDKLVVVCDNYTCSQKHEARFKISK